MTRRPTIPIGLLAVILLGPAQAVTDPSRCYAIRDADMRNACLAETRDDKRPAISRQCGFQGLDTEPCIHAVGEFPGQHFPRVPVDDGHAEKQRSAA